VTRKCDNRHIFRGPQQLLSKNFKKKRQYESLKRTILFTWHKVSPPKEFYIAQKGTKHKINTHMTEVLTKNWNTLGSKNTRFTRKAKPEKEDTFKINCPTAKHSH
jgi:hypothetical protein